MVEGRLAVVAVGGNSLITSNTKRWVPDQFDAAAVSMRYVADMVEAGWRVVLTHGLNAAGVAAGSARAGFSAAAVTADDPHACGV